MICRLPHPQSSFQTLETVFIPASSLNDCHACSLPLLEKIPCEDFHMLSNLEVAVFVEVSAGEPDHIGHGGHITVGVWEEEEVHAAARCHTLLAQLAIERSLRGQEALENNTYTSVWIRTERQQTLFWMEWQTCGAEMTAVFRIMNCSEAWRTNQTFQNLRFGLNWRGEIFPSLCRCDTQLASCTPSATSWQENEYVLQSLTYLFMSQSACCIYLPL